MINMSYYSYISLEIPKVDSSFNAVYILNYAMGVLLDIRTNVSKNAFSKFM